MLEVGCGPAPPAQTSEGASATKDLFIDQATKDLMAIEHEVRVLMDAEDYAAAEALVDQRIGNPLHGTFMARCKAELLAKRGADAEALDMYLDLFGGQYGHFSLSNFANLAEAFLLAEGLERWADADTVATLLLANQSGVFGNYPPLQTPTAAGTPNERLAYTYLTLALEAGSAFDGDYVESYQKEVEYCLKAKALLPNSTIVLVQTALAYHFRDGINGIEQCRTLLTQAYNQEAGNAEMRAEIARWARVCGAVPFP